MTHDDDLNDADLYPLISDHVPGESSRLAALDQAFRDGRLWAVDDPTHAREVLIEATTCPVCRGRGVSTPASYTFQCPCPICHGSGRKEIEDEDRRAWLDGVAEGLNGYAR